MTAKALPVVGEYDPRAAGERTITRAGYVNSNGGREHMVVAALAFGGILPRGYEVHHVNEIKTDNRPENLVVCETRRLHHLLHAVPALLERCEWLGAPTASVRLFRAFDPPGTYFCVRCERSKPFAEFSRSVKYASGLRGECAECRNKGLFDFKKTHPTAQRTVRGRPGELHHNAKLTERDVVTIRRLHARGETQAALAVRFGVAGSAINRIVLRKRWKHAP